MSAARRPKRFKLWDAARLQTASDMYLSGMNCAQIAEKLESNPGRVKIVLRSIGIELQRFHRDSAKVWNAHRDYMVSELYRCGLSQAELAWLYKTNIHRVADALRRCRVKIRPVDMKGSKNPAWKGGRKLDADGYVLIHKPEHPFAARGGYVPEHRLVMEKIIGRYLKPEEVVHHIRPPKTNNSPENLQLFASNADHLRAELTGKCPNWTEEGRKRLREALNRRRA